MASLFTIGVVSTVSGACGLLLVLAKTLGRPEDVLANIGVDLAMDHFTLDLDHLVFYLVVLWASLAATVLLWWLVRGVTLWLRKPRAKRAEPVLPPLTVDQLMEQARETFKKRISCIDQSDLPADAKKQAKQEAGRQYMHEVKQVLQ